MQLFWLGLSRCIVAAKCEYKTVFEPGLKLLGALRISDSVDALGLQVQSELVQKPQLYGLLGQYGTFAAGIHLRAGALPYHATAAFVCTTKVWQIRLWNHVKSWAAGRQVECKWIAAVGPVASCVKHQTQ